MRATCMVLVGCAVLATWVAPPRTVADEKLRMAASKTAISREAEQSGAVVNSPADSQSQVQGIDLFDAMEQELVEVQFVALGSHRANVKLTNNTDDVIHLSLPKSFGAVQVLAQVGNGGFGGPGGGLGNGNGFGGGNFGGGNQGGGQGIGGGFGNFGGGNFGGANAGGGNFGGGGFGMGNQGGGFFRIEPQKTRKLSVNCVCLEFGKPDPTPRMKYQLVRLSEVNAMPEVRELCEQLANNAVSQTAAQAAAWHLANGLSWEELKGLNRIESLFTGNVPRFNKSELSAALNLVSYCRGTVKYTGSETSTSSSTGDLHVSR